MIWSNNYLGIPYREFGRAFTGCDCWGIVYLVYQSECGITLPTYDHAYHSTEERAEISALINDAKASAVWTQIERPKPFDLATFRRGTQTSHIGIVVTPNWMLHMSEAGARLENYKEPVWRHRLTGIFRHERLA